MFEDRIDAGKKLSEKLLTYKGRKIIVFAIPRGGVVVAYEVAKALDAPLDLVVPRKIGSPSDPEFAIGAVAPDKSVVLNEEIIRELQIPKNYIDVTVKKESEEINRRLKKYRGSENYVLLKGKVVILVDDGIATGYTMKASVKFLKKKSPEKIIVAIPVGPYDSISELEKEVDEVVVIEVPEYFQAIGMHYYNFPQVSDEEVIELLKKIKKLTKK